MAAPSPTDEPSRPPTRSSRSHTVSEAPLGVLRDGLSRTRSGSTSTIGEDDAGSTYSHATLGRRQRALASSPHTGGRRPSLPIALLGTKSPNPVSVFGLKPPPQAARKWTEAAFDSSGGDDDDDWERDERHFAGQRATFSAKVNQQLLTSSLSVDAIGSTAAAAAPFATSQDDTTAASGGSESRRPLGARRAREADRPCLALPFRSRSDRPPQVETGLEPQALNAGQASPCSLTLGRPGRQPSEPRRAAHVARAPLSRMALFPLPRDECARSNASGWQTAIARTSLDRAASSGKMSDVREHQHRLLVRAPRRRDASDFGGRC